jgi:hypothetical protein
VAWLMVALVLSTSARPPGDGADARGGTDLGASARWASVGAGSAALRAAGCAGGTGSRGLTPNA